MEQEIIKVMEIFEIETILRHIKIKYKDANPLIKWKIWYFLKRLSRR